MSEARVQPPHPEHAAGWTEDRIRVLTAMWTNGHSASQIMAALGGGLTRSAVIGKVHRLNLPKRAKDVSHTTKAQRTDARMKREPGTPHANRGQPKANAIIAAAERRRAPTPSPEAFDMEDGEPVDVTRLVGVMDLERTSCRWPMGSATGSAQLFCGKHAAAGSYCPEHTKRAAYGFGNGARP